MGLAGGDITQYVSQGREAVRLAESSGDGVYRLGAGVAVATALFFSGSPAESLEISLAAQESAEEALREVDTRRLGMIVALAVILVTIVALIFVKLELDRDLEAERARRHDTAPNV